MLECQCRDTRPTTDAPGTDTGNSVCPNCGYCPCCGRPNYPYWMGPYWYRPYFPYTDPLYYGPIWTMTSPNVTCNTSTVS